jgi:hypothetical protein
MIRCCNARSDPNPLTANQVHFPYLMESIEEDEKLDSGEEDFEDEEDL